MPTNEPSAPGLDKGWAWVVMVASFASFFVIGGPMYASGLIHAALLERFNDTEASTAWVGSLQTSLMSVAAPLGSSISDRFSCRISLMVSGFLMSCGYLTTTFAPSLYWCVFTCGIIAEVGGGIGYTTSIVVVGYNFKQKRNIATGFAVSGVGVGVFALSPAVEAARLYYGISGFFISLSAITIHLLVFGMLCRPSALELQLQRKRMTEERRNSEKRFSLYNLKGYVYLCTNKAVACLSMSYFLYGLAVYMIFLHLPNYCVHKGFTSIQASFLLSVAGICSVLSRILTGLAASSPDIDEIMLFSGSFGMLALTTFLFPLFSSTYTGQLAYSVMLGLYFGGCYAVLNTINVQLVGVKHFSTAVGIEFFYCGVGATIGPVIAGISIDAGGTYEQSFFIAACCLLLSAFLGLMTIVVRTPDKEDRRDVDLVISKDTLSNSATVGATETLELENISINPRTEIVSIEENCLVSHGNANVDTVDDVENIPFLEELEEKQIQDS